MAYRTLYFRKEDGSKAARYFIFDTAAELLTSTLVVGDIAYTVDTKAYYIADSTTTWAFIDGSSYLAITALRTLDVTDSTVNCTANSFTVTLPTAVGISGRIYNIKNSGTGVITIATTSSQTIDGQASSAITLNQYDNLTVQSNNANWIIL